MIYAIVIGRDNSRGLPGKNHLKINGMPLMAYPIQAALNSKYVDEVYFSTESRRLKYIAEKWGATVIDRPKELAIDEALSDDVFIHAYEWLIENGSINTYGDAIALDVDTIRELKKRNIEFLLLMFANSPCVNSWMIDEMIEILRGDPKADSICTISLYNMYSPIRMRKFRKDIIYEDVDIVKHEIVENDESVNINIDVEVYGDITREETDYVVPYVPEILEGSTCDRDSGEDSYIYDCSCAIVRPDCIEEIEDGQLPQRWLGKNILGYKQTIPAIDIDFKWQLGQLQYWIDTHWY